VRSEISRELEKRGKTGLEFNVVSNPEFLKEGSAIEDFLRADRVVIGTDNFRAGELMKELYDPFQRKGEKILIMDVKSAELTKYAANAMLAVRISFMNEIASLCEACGADIEKVREGIGSDSRIGRSFLYAGIGYGGSCFPKDIKAIIRIEKEFGIEPRILPAVEEVNRLQRSRFVNRVLETFGSDLTGKVFAVWGLAFKPQTDDMREAPSIDILGGLKRHGAQFRVFDPVAMKTAREVLGDEGFEYVTNYYEALQGAEALLLLTEWHQFRRPDYDKMKALMKNHIVFDGRNQYEPMKMREKGFKYYCIGRP
jgi:UDPglucose 6-dehydrogenase